MHIAIVVPAFNIAPFLGDCLLSVLAQTHTDWSLVVVDDGSSDEIAAVADRFQDKRIQWRRQDNAGVSAARNAGIAMALSLPKTAYLSIEPRPRDRRDATMAACPSSLAFSAPVKTENTDPPDDLGTLSSGRSAAHALLFVDGDDWLAPDALALLAEGLDNAPGAVAACGRYARVTQQGAAHVSPPLPSGPLLERLLIRNLFANGGHLLIRREAVENAGDFRRDLSYGEDWEYWTRLALQGDFVSLNSLTPVLYVRERQGSAYLSHASDPAAYQPAVATIYGNSAILERLGRSRLADLRRRAEAETAWTIGRELVRHGRLREGRRWLGRSIRAAPTLKRLLLIALSWPRLAPFRPYQSPG